MHIVVDISWSLPVSFHRRGQCRRDYYPLGIVNISAPPMANNPMHNIGVGTVIHPKHNRYIEGDDEGSRLLLHSASMLVVSPNRTPSSPDQVDNDRP